MVNECALLTCKEVAVVLKVTKSTVHRWIKEGVINAYKIGGSLRFKSDEIEGFLQSLSSKKNK
jgi:excisionase family DNA binding protein